MVKKNQFVWEIPSLGLTNNEHLWTKRIKQFDCTTVQSQFFMEGVEFVLDLLGTGAVLPCTEIQQDVDLQEKDK